ncbi:MAG: 16S rRNA (cytidine(1402)-2'-O)-methyltransferase [Candidatus Kerfeldbacteria bacterium]|nr:16S rRNA (cytidine(1402)-2'-O)-methyltransferase [Candidatus Kerfeldbacteria bacterium]
MGVIYSVATPIGNLEDITVRALRILNEVELIVCEDTRVSRILLQHYNIHQPTSSIHQHSTPQQRQRIIDQVQAGQSIAMITDAGTPGISDPGVALIQQAIAQGVRVIPIPGASAVITALQAAGVDCSRFLFIGFLPHKKGRHTWLQTVIDYPGTVVMYESPHRLLKTLTVLGASKRRVVVARELTKLHEEFVQGTAQQVYEEFAKRSKILGEYVIIVH